MVESLPEPMVPPNCDLRDFPFTPIFRARLFGSSFHARVTDAEWRAGVTLWLKSWDQTPTGSLPDDDVDLCRLAELGRDGKAWKKIRAGALRNWVKCSDGRLYHAVVAEGVLNAWREKTEARWRSEIARIKKHNQRYHTNVPLPTYDEFEASGPVHLDRRGGVDPDPQGDLSLGTDGFVPRDDGGLSLGTDGACPGSVPRETDSKRREEKRSKERKKEGESSLRSLSPSAGAGALAQVTGEGADADVVWLYSAEITAFFFAAGKYTHEHIRATIGEWLRFHKASAVREAVETARVTACVDGLAYANKCLQRAKAKASEGVLRSGAASEKPAEPWVEAGVTQAEWEAM